MKQELCDRLIDALLSRGGAILPQKVQATYDLLEELFAPEEAELACTMPLELATAEKIAEGAISTKHFIHSCEELFKGKKIVNLI